MQRDQKVSWKWIGNVQRCTFRGKVQAGLFKHNATDSGAEGAGGGWGGGGWLSAASVAGLSLTRPPAGALGPVPAQGALCGVIQGSPPSPDKKIRLHGGHMGKLAAAKKTAKRCTKLQNTKTGRCKKKNGKNCISYFFHSLDCPWASGDAAHKNNKSRASCKES